MFSFTVVNFEGMENENRPKGESTEKIKSILFPGGASEHKKPIRIRDFLINASLQPEHDEFIELENLDQQLHVVNYESNVGRRCGVTLNR